MVVKRNTHHKPVVPRVQPLLKCAPSCRVRTLWMDDEARGHHTERSLQLDDSHHDRNNIARHPSTAARVTGAPPSSSSSNPAEREWLASPSCEAGLSQCHPHIARYHTTTCQQLPTPQRESLHHAAQPLSTGWVHTRHSWVDGKAA
jgi:hypothetical protein